MAITEKIKEVYISSSNSRIYPKELKLGTQDTCTTMFVTQMSMKRWINKQVWGIRTMGY